MADNTAYAVDDYFECDYVVGNECADQETVKVFGFSKKITKVSKNEKDSQLIKSKYNKKYGRNAFVFPDQS